MVNFINYTNIEHRPTSYIENILKWFDNNIFFLYVILQFIAYIINGICSLILESQHMMHELCPISNIWNNLFAQVVVSSYGIIYIIALNIYLDDVCIIWHNIIYYIDIINLIACVTLIIYNITSLSYCYSSKISNTHIYNASQFLIIPLFCFLIYEIIIVYKKRIAITTNNNITSTTSINIQLNSSLDSQQNTYQSIYHPFDQYNQQQTLIV